jgi:hypothetical protein
MPLLNINNITLNDNITTSMIQNIPNQNVIYSNRVTLVGFSDRGDFRNRLSNTDYVAHPEIISFQLPSGCESAEIPQSVDDR